MALEQDILKAYADIEHHLARRDEVLSMVARKMRYLEKWLKDEHGVEIVDRHTVDGIQTDGFVRKIKKSSPRGEDYAGR